MQTIGERLEEARKRKGISIREAAEATKIRGDYLQKFESNQFDADLPEIYARGFLRAYAHFLKLPAEKILADYRALGLGEQKPRPPSREIYGRMDLSIASAGSSVQDSEPESGPAAEGGVTDAGESRARKFTKIGTSLPEGTYYDPRLVMKIVKIVGGVVLAGLLVWGGLSLTRTGATKRAAAAPPVAEPTITLVALDSVRVHVEQKNPDESTGPVILPETTLVRGETRVIPRRVALYISAEPRQNLEIEVNGKRYPMPSDSPRGQVLAP
ncbi:MAG TPA: helix-turn-helix domain-containing protein [Opitutaceae bacterium]|nr:helix-turn-helix domain-containing protein [Opitutaceae bacterium]